MRSKIEWGKGRELTFIKCLLCIGTGLGIFHALFIETSEKSWEEGEIIIIII